MPITLVPDTPLNQVRLNIGDDDGALISDDTINGLLLAYNDDVRLASLKAFDYIIAALAKYRDERTDEVSVDWSQMYKQYVQLKKDFERDNIAAAGADAIFFGGTLKSENDKYYHDTDTTGCPVRSGDCLDPIKQVSPYDPFYLEDW